MSDRVIVIGGGIAGMRSALDLAQAGAHVTIVETKATIGGKLASILEEENQALDLPQPSAVASMEAVTKHPNIEVLTFADVMSASGGAGDFSVSIRQRQRFVSDACDRCAQCRQVCPVVRPNEYDAGLSYRKAIFSPLRNAWPPIYAIDIESCLNEPPNYIPCNRCVQTCHVNAIRFNQPLERVLTRNAAAIIVAMGFDLVDLRTLDSYGYGSHPDILTSMELERLFASSGITGGYAARPSNEQDPASVLFVICDNTDFTWTYTSRQISRLIDQAIENVTLIYEQPPSNGATPESFLKGHATHTVHLIQGKSKSIKPNGTNTVRLEFRDQASNKDLSKEFEMVVLATAVLPPAGLAALAERLGFQIGPDGYTKVDGVATSRPGVFVAGCAAGPKNIQATIAQSNIAVQAALKHAAVAPQPQTAPADGAAAPTATLPADLQARFQQAVLTLIEMGQKAKQEP